MSKQISNGVYFVGVLNPNLRVFDIVMKTEYGTSYNAYIVKGTEKTALIETSHLRFFDYFVDNIKEICPLEEIDYIITNHNEPDHSGVVAKLCDAIPNVTVVTSQAGSIYLKAITNKKDLNLMVAKDGQTIDLGGKELRFINAPFLHWPDSMFTWLEQDNILFSCDFLGSHYCEPQLFDTRIGYREQYLQAFQGYYDAIFGPFKPYVLNGLDKIKSLPIRYVCTSHGPVLTQEGLLAYTIEMYTKWSTPQPRSHKLIPVFYCSAYGNTTQVAETICQGVKSVLPDAQCEKYDIINHDMDMLSALLNQSDAFLIGSPTINRDAVPPAWQLLSHIDAINNQKKPCAVFGSYGWSGEAVPMLTERLSRLRLKVLGEGLKVNFVPNQEDLDRAFALGAQIAESLIQTAESPTK